MQTYPIAIHVYDISGGLAQQFSMMFLGKQIDAIYHTGLIAYGKEYYFGGGICQGVPGQTPYGNPSKREELGNTEITQETFEEYLQGINKDFSMENYDLFDNNCNNFTDEAAKFLVGKGIPEYIIGLPKEILNTPFGQVIKPIVDGITKSMQQQSGQQMLPAMFEGQNNPQAMFAQQQQQLYQQQQQQQPQKQQIVKELKNLDDFMEACEQSPSMIIDCYSLQCPPCQVIKPIYEKLAEEYSVKYPGLHFYSADVNAATDIGESLDVQKIPTFFLYKGYELITQFSGADENLLKEKIEAFGNEVQEK